MAVRGNLSIRAFTVSEVRRYLLLVRAVDTWSGVGGAGHSHAYGESEPFDMDAGSDRELKRWSTSIDDVGWRRAWGLFDQDEPVGSLNLAGGALYSELHRVNMGMGILRSHQRQGGGSMLLETAIEWAQEQAGIAWIDLGVFSDNFGAQAMYERHGFEVLGLTSDRFRVDGSSLDEVLMTLNVDPILG